MRVKLGESLPSITGEQRAYEHNVTTTSLEALQAFQLGDAEFTRTGDRRSTIPFYERATQLDPNFALAWTILGLQYGGSGDPERWKSYSAKAYGMVDQVSERERLVITSMYHKAHGDEDKAMEIDEVLARTYPRDPMLHVNLAGDLLVRGEWLRAIEESGLAIRHGPKIVQGYGSMVSALLALERTAEAKEVIGQAFAQGVDAPGLHSTQLYIAYAEGDLQTQERERRWFSGKPLEVMALRHEANNSAALGRAQAATSQYQKAVDLARQRSPGNPTALLGEKAMMAALFENCGLLDAAERKAPEVGALCLNDAEAWKFVERQLGDARGVDSGPAAHLQGVMLLRAGKTGEAQTHFQGMVGRRVSNWGPEYPAAYIGLARAAARQGDIPTAKKAYEDFFVLWKDADSDIPLLIAARKEYSRLAVK
jgi:tetratricopeptide (TPR) repeat protein